MAAEKNPETSHVLPENFGKGPHGLGDPDDRSLRKVEMEVLIPKIMRKKAKEENCTAVVGKFEECCKAAGLMMAFKCRTETKALRECLKQWYDDPEFKQDCTEEYLKDRSEYRKTGLKQEARRKESSSF